MTTKKQQQELMAEYAEENLSPEEIGLLADRYIKLNAKHNKRLKKLDEMKAILRPLVIAKGPIVASLGTLSVETRHSESYKKDKIEILIEMGLIDRGIIAKALESHDSDALVVRVNVDR